MDKLRKLVLVLLLSLPLLVFAGQPVDINTADKETLMTVKGIGERRAEAIIAYREHNGPFRTVDELLDVQGIGENILDENRELFVVSTAN